MESNELTVFEQIFVWLGVGLIGAMFLELYRRLAKSKVGQTINKTVKPGKKINFWYVMLGMLVLILIVYLMTQNANESLSNG